MVDLKNIQSLHQKLEPLDPKQKMQGVKSHWVHGDLKVKHKSIVGKWLHKWIVTHWFFDKVFSISLKNAVFNLEKIAREPTHASFSSSHVFNACDTLELYINRLKAKNRQPLIDKIEEIRKLLTNPNSSEPTQKPLDHPNSSVPTQKPVGNPNSSAPTQKPVGNPMQTEIPHEDGEGGVVEAVQLAKTLFAIGNAKKGIDVVRDFLINKGNAAEALEFAANSLQKEQINLADFHEIVNEVTKKEENATPFFQLIQNTSQSKPAIFKALIPLAVNKYPEKVAELVSLSQNLVQQGKIRAASFALDEILKKNPHHIPAQLLKSDVSKILNHPDPELDKVLAQNPNHIEALQKHALLSYQRRLQPEFWQEDLQKLIAIEPNNPVHAILQAKFYLNEHETEKTLELIKQSLVKFPENPELLFLFFRAIGKSIEDHQRSPEECPLLFKKDELYEILDQLQAIPQNSPYYIIACRFRYEIKFLLTKEGTVVQQLIPLNEGFQTNPDDIYLLVTRGFFHHCNDSFDQARQDYTKVINHLAMNNIPLIDILSKDAIWSMEEVCPNDILVLEAAIQTCFYAGNHVKLPELLERALIIDPNHVRLNKLNGIHNYIISRMTQDKKLYNERLQAAVAAFKNVLKAEPEDEAALALLHACYQLDPQIDPQNAEVKQIEAKWQLRIKQNPFQKSLKEWASFPSLFRRNLRTRIDRATFLQDTLICKEILEEKDVIHGFRLEGPDIF